MLANKRLSSILNTPRYNLYLQSSANTPGEFYGFKGKIDPGYPYY